MGPRSLIFFLGMSWQGMVHCPWHSLSQPSTLPCSFSPFTCRIHSSFFPDWRRAVSTKSFDTQVPSVSTEEFVLFCHAHCVFSHLRCNEHSPLLNFFLMAELRVFCAASVVIRPWTPLISFCINLLRTLFLRLAFWRLRFPPQPVIQALSSSPVSEAAWSSTGKGRVTTATALVLSYSDVCFCFFVFFAPHLMALFVLKM